MVDVTVMFGAGDQDVASSLARELKRADIDTTLAPAAGTAESAVVNPAARVLVLWSEASSNSTEIFEAASAAMARGKLINLTISRVATPRIFAGSPSFDLTGWRTYRSPSALGELLGVLAPQSPSPAMTVVVHNAPSGRSDAAPEMSPPFVPTTPGSDAMAVVGRTGRRSLVPWIVGAATAAAGAAVVVVFANQSSVVGNTDHAAVTRAPSIAGLRVASNPALDAVAQTPTTGAEAPRLVGNSPPIAAVVTHPAPGAASAVAVTPAAPIPAPAAAQVAPPAAADAHRVDDAQAFASARIAGSLPAYTQFLRDFPASDYADEARLARAALVLNRPYSIDGVDPSLQQMVERARNTATGAAQQAARARVLNNANASPRTENLEAGRYEGDWSRGGANGLGTAVSADGRQYFGAWRGSQFNGPGVLIYNSGVVYEGAFANGTPTAQGVFWGADGRRLTGHALFSALVGR